MRSYDQYCGLALALDRIGERWTLLIVRELLTGPKRFSDLSRGLPGIATNLLSDRLKSMEAEGLITRDTLPPPAASVVYVLTGLGLELENAVHELVRWGGNFMRRRSRGQVFQPTWIALALRAIRRDRVGTVPTPLVAAIELPEGSVTLRFDEHDTRIVSGGPPPDVHLRGRAELVLGVASGSLDWETAQSRGLRVTGSAPHKAALRSLFPVRDQAGSA